MQKAARCANNRYFFPDLLPVMGISALGFDAEQRARSERARLLVADGDASRLVGAQHALNAGLVVAHGLPLSSSSTVSGDISCSAVGI